MIMSRLARGTPGFTLVELLMASIVLAILLALAAPPLARGERRWAAYAAGRTLAAEVARARQRAIQNRQTVRVVLDTLAGTYEVRPSSGDPLPRRRLRPDLRLGTTAYRQEILFSGRGTSSLYAAAWVGVRDDPGAREHRIRVLPTGAIEGP
jgi:prepilin-type N-terminal cleavage/methylation domain-containing protein